MPRQPSQPHRKPLNDPDVIPDWLAALEVRIAAEDAEDARRERRRIKAGLPEPPRKPIKVFDGWASTGVTPRELR